MTNTRKFIYTVIISAGLGWLGCRYLSEPKVITKVETVEVERIVTDVREVITENPDGSRRIERDTRSVKDKESQARQETAPAKGKWGVGVSVGVIDDSDVYTLNIHRRLFDDFYVSGYGRTDGSGGLGLTIMF